MISENTANDEQVEQQSTPEFLSKAPNMGVAAFNALCEDGVFRTVFIHPQDVTDIKRIAPAVQGVKTVIGYNKILGDETEMPGTIFVAEWFGDVLSALGAMETASKHYTHNYFLSAVTHKEQGFKYDKASEGLKYCPVLQQPTSSTAE